MIPFLSQLDLLVVAGVVAGLSGLSGAVFLLARHQRPATRPIAQVAEVEVLPASATAEAAGRAAAA